MALPCFDYMKTDECFYSNCAVNCPREAVIRVIFNHMKPTPEDFDSTGGEERVFCPVEANDAVSAWL
jgi:hypothetical protein